MRGESRTGNEVPSSLGGAKNGTRKIRGGRRRTFFQVAARHAWPRKTAFELARHTGAPLRTCYRWLAGTTEPPGSILLAVVGEANRADGRL